MLLQQLCRAFMIAVCAFAFQCSAGVRKNHHKFVNKSDMAIQVSVLYVPIGKLCGSDTARINPGKDWTAQGKLCCVKRIDFRDARANKFLKFGTSDLKIKIRNTDPVKLHDAGTAFLAVGTLAAAAQGDGTGTLLGAYALDAQARINPTTETPVIECAENSTWTYEGSGGVYTLRGPSGFVWNVNL